MLDNEPDYEMETDEKVFRSEISRVDSDTESNLYNLLNIEPAVPVPQFSQNSNNNQWEFKPKSNKQYLPKNLKSKLKVSTVRDVRLVFEKDVCSYLPNELDRQQNYLLRKIRDGSSNDEKTIQTAIALVHGNNPISRSSWQMLSNMNAENHHHSKQFVLWNGQCIQVNGSRGGKTKFICNYDLSKTTNKINKSLKTSPRWKTCAIKSKKGLLRNSLNVKFKPGPLGKKKFLDESHQKYQMGNIELIKLPSPVLEISPTYGITLDPTIASFVNKLRGEKGAISSKLAEFSVSALGTLKNNTPSQINESCNISFDLRYKCDQNRILMRRDDVKAAVCPNNGNDLGRHKHLIATSPEIPSGTKNSINTYSDVQHTAEMNMSLSDESMFEVNQILNDMLNSVEISLNQDYMYSTEDKHRDTIEDDGKNLSVIKDKLPKRKYFELDKLDVTIIELPKSPKKDYNKNCDKLFCTMGCVCESLHSVLRLKQHCGVFDCMFGCKCKVSKYRNIDLLEQVSSDIIPGLFNLDKEINSHLAKEEQKFHQTVILHGEKSILLKSRKRNWKCSNKYAEYFSKNKLKYDENMKKILTVNVQKLCCSNIEPLCMVHNLYKCFCSGKFTESYVCNDIDKKSTKSLNTENNKIEHEINVDINSDVRKTLRPRLRNVNQKYCYDMENNSTNYTKVLNARNCSHYSDDIEQVSFECARTMGCHIRKHSEEYYTRTNNKIIEMEKNDSLLKKKMFRLIYGNKQLQPTQTINSSSELLDCETTNGSEENDIFSHSNLVNEAGDKFTVSSNKMEETDKDLNYHLGNSTNKIGLQEWLEKNYISYKERLKKGLIKNSLEAPQKGKVALQTWDFILSRYRERKNVFLVSKEKPYRTFLAVDANLPFFTMCTINIDDIRFTDLPKYPAIVQNLVTNATDVENSFCIIRGWVHCWELIGSAVKLFEHNNTTDSEERSVDDLWTNSCSFDNENDSSFRERNNGETSFDDDQSMSSSQSMGLSQDIDMLMISEVKNVSLLEKHDTHTEKSKWFVLKIENDFKVIQFYNKGFFVTYDTIQRTIRIARISRKTVRMSSRAQLEHTQSSTHQFGMYAIPCVSESYVFIGPYELNEPLGIELVKNYNIAKTLQKETRGVWINVNKVENSKVIDNPLAYLPSESIESESIPTVEGASDDSAANPNRSNSSQLIEMQKTPEKDVQIDQGASFTKHIKPIRIRRTNGFYHMSSKNVIHKITTNDIYVNKNRSIKKKPLQKKAKAYPISLLIKPALDVALPATSTSSVPHVRPVAEIAPQIKITSVYSEKTIQYLRASEKSKQSSMLILKPEEINKKVQATAVDERAETDIEKFLKISKICIAPKDEVFVISDGEDEPASPCKDVWIQCSNVEKFGYLRAKLNDDNTRISFEFPGFKYSEFYPEAEAFYKINQVLARKMYIPKNVRLQWQVVRDKQNLKSDRITQKCLEDKKYLLIKLRKQRDNSLKPVKENGEKEKNTENAETKDEQMKLIEGLEEASRKLEHQSTVLWNEAVTRRDEILGSLSVPDNLKDKMKETLHDIMSLNEQ